MARVMVNNGVSPTASLDVSVVPCLQIRNIVCARRLVVRKRVPELVLVLPQEGVGTRGGALHTTQNILGGPASSFTCEDLATRKV